MLVGSTAFEDEDFTAAAAVHDDDAVDEVAADELFRDAFCLMAPPDAEEDEDVASQNSDRRERKLLDMVY